MNLKYFTFTIKEIKYYAAAPYGQRKVTAYFSTLLVNVREVERERISAVKFQAVSVKLYENFA